MMTQSPFLPSSPVLIRLEPVRAWLEELSLDLQIDAADGAYLVFEERRSLMRRLARNRDRYRLTILDWACVGRFTYYFELKWDRLVLVRIELDTPPPTDPSGAGLAAAFVVKSRVGNRIFSARAKPRISAVAPVVPPRAVPALAAVGAIPYSERVILPAVDSAGTQAVVGATVARPATTVARKAGWSGRRNPFDIQRVFVADLIQWLIVNHAASSVSRAPHRTAARAESAAGRAERLALRLAQVVGATNRLPRHRERVIVQAMMMLALDAQPAPALSRQKITRLMRSVHAIMPSGWPTKMDSEIGSGGRHASRCLSQIFGMQADLEHFFFANLWKSDETVADVRVDALVR